MISFGSVSTAITEFTGDYTVITLYDDDDDSEVFTNIATIIAMHFGAIGILRKSRTLIRELCVFQKVNETNRPS